MLVLRGVHSDLLSFDLAAEMRKRNRTANVFWFDNCGHVPPLTEQIDVVSRFRAWRREFRCARALRFESEAGRLRRLADDPIMNIPSPPGAAA
jgi:pimeloyl-ACP methyl ester carboxylesterase